MSNEPLGSLTGEGLSYYLCRHCGQSTQLDGDGIDLVQMYARLQQAEDDADVLTEYAQEMDDRLAEAKRYIRDVDQNGNAFWEKLMADEVAQEAARKRRADSARKSGVKEE
jgi:hypothetical protein